MSNIADLEHSSTGDVSMYEPYISEKIIQEFSNFLKLDKKVIREQVFTAVSAYWVGKTCVSYAARAGDQKKKVEKFNKKVREAYLACEELTKDHFANSVVFQVFEKFPEKFEECEDLLSLFYEKTGESSGRHHIGMMRVLLGMMAVAAETAFEEANFSGPVRREKFPELKGLIIALLPLYKKAAVLLTEGHYIPEAGETISTSVDLIEQLLNEVDPSHKLDRTIVSDHVKRLKNIKLPL